MLWEPVPPAQTLTVGGPSADVAAEDYDSLPQFLKMEKVALLAAPANAAFHQALHVI